MSDTVETVEFDLRIPVKVEHVQRDGAADVLDYEQKDEVLVSVTVVRRDGEDLDAASERAVDALTRVIQGLLDAASVSP